MVSHSIIEYNHHTIESKNMIEKYQKVKLFQKINIQNQSMFLFHLFIQSARTIATKSPIVLTPGLYGTNLYVNYSKGTPVPWYCPSSMHDELIWITPMSVIPPFINCQHHLCQATFDPATETIHNLDGVTFSIHDFGGIESIDYVVKSWFGKFYDGFKSLIDHYLRRNYKIKQNFFAAPYDWRIAPQFVDDFWINYRKLIEEAYEKSNGRKVTLVGFSMGCFMIQQFLTAEKTFESNDGLFHSIRNKSLIVDESWKEKYIEKVVLIAPSFGGTFTYFESMILRVSLLFPYARNEHISDMSSSLPGFHSHHPNFVIFKNYTLAKGPDGKNYTIEELDEVILKHSHIKESFIPAFKTCLDLQKKAPVDIGENIPLAIIYNSGVKTLSFLDFSKGWNKYPIKYYNGKGDGTLPVDAPLYPCNNWSADNRALVCIDVNRSDPKKFKHSSLQNNPLIFEILYNLTSADSGKNDENLWWKKKGRYSFILNESNSNDFSCLNSDL